MKGIESLVFLVSCFWCFCTSCLILFFYSLHFILVSCSSMFWKYFVISRTTCMIHWCVLILSSFLYCAHLMSVTFYFALCLCALAEISITFNSLSKVLEPVFSFRWNFPPYLRSNSEEHDSENDCSGFRLELGEANGSYRKAFIWNTKCWTAFHIVSMYLPARPWTNRNIWYTDILIYPPVVKAGYGKSPMDIIEIPSRWLFWKHDFQMARAR